jgi:DNA-binding phage protein
MDLTVADKKRIVSDFLRHCVDYADDKLLAYRQRLPDVAGMDALALQDKISHWTAYRAFSEYTIVELRTTELDAWFTDEKGP